MRMQCPYRVQRAARYGAAAGCRSRKNSGEGGKKINKNNVL
jgi:hypothetical protein